MWTYGVGHLQIQRRVASGSGGGRCVDAGGGVEALPTSKGRD